MKKLLLISIVLLLTTGIASALDIALDDFETNSFNGGTGWDGAWSYSGGCEISTLNDPIDSYHMRGQSGCDAERTFDATGLSSLNITFSAKATSLEAGEFCDYYYYDGSSYTLITSIVDGADDNIYRQYSYVPTVLSANSAIRVQQTGGLADWCMIDNINISGEPFHPPNITSVVVPLECRQDCYVDITVADPQSDDVVITGFDWFLYIPYLQVPALSPDLYMTLHTSPTGLTTRIPLDMELEFGANNYPRAEAIITVMDSDGESATKKSNLFRIRLDTYVDSVGSVEDTVSSSDALKVWGTEYIAGDYGRIFLQLKDNQGLPENQGSCYIDIYYPPHVNDTAEEFIDNGAMLHLEGSDGIYYYDISSMPDIPGVYMVTAGCNAQLSSAFVYYTDGTDPDGPLRTSIIGTHSSSTITLNAYQDYSYTSCSASGGGTKTCQATYLYDLKKHFSENASFNDLSLYYMGEASINALLQFSVWNYTSSSWIVLPNTLTYSGLATAGPTGLNDFVSNMLPENDIIGPNRTILIRMTASSGKAFQQYNNWLNINLKTSSGIVQELKGSSELHISNLYDQLTDEINEVHLEVWNSTNRTLTASENLWIGGTEYSEVENAGKVVVRMTDATGGPVTGATCTFSALYPNNTVYINASPMTEYLSGTHDGIYYIDFNLTGVVGVHPYAVDCLKAGKDYYLLGTFHIFSSAEAQLGSIYSLIEMVNTTVTTIDGRTVSIESIVNDTNNRLVLLNGTIYDMYALLLQMNATITNIYDYAQSINATVIDIQGTINGIETVVLSINGTVVSIQEDVIVINNTLNSVQTTVEDTNSRVIGIESSILYLNNTLNWIQSALLNINGTVIYTQGVVDSIYGAVITINGTVNGIEDVTLQINGTVTSIENIVGGINDTVTSIEEATITIIGNQVIINGTVNDIQDTVVTINGTVNTIEGIATTINNTLSAVYDEVLVNQAGIITINTTVNGIQNSLFEINGTLYNIWADIWSVNNTLNAHTANFTARFDEVLASINSVNDTLNLQTSNFTARFDEVLSYIVSTNNTLVAEISSLYSLVNDTQNNQSAMLQSIYDLIENNNLSLSAELQSLYDLVNTTQTAQDTRLDEIYDHISAVNGSLSNDLSEIYSFLESMNTTQSQQLSDLLIVADEMNITTHQTYDFLTTLNTTLSQELVSIYDLVNNTQAAQTAILNQLLQYADDTNSTVNDLLAISILTNMTVNQVWNLTQQLDIDLSTLYALNLLMDGKLDNITGSLSAMNLTLEAIQDATVTIIGNQVVINGTVNNIEGVVITINGTVTSIENKVDTALGYLLEMNATITDIEGYVLSLNLTSNEIYDLLSLVNATTNTIEGLSININNSIEYFNTTLGDMTAILNQINSVSLYMNDTTIEIRDVVLNLSSDLDALYNLTLTINGTVFSYLSELSLIQELIINQTNLLKIAIANVSYFTDQNASDYYQNHTLLTPSILETQMIKYSIETIQLPLEGSTFDVYYYYFRDDGSGELVKTDKATIVGVDEHEIYLSSTGIDPGGLEGDFQVWARVEMLNGDGLYQSFPLHNVGKLTIGALTKAHPGSPGLYDVIISSVYDQYESGEKVTADILIKNTGDAPDEDTVLTYWLENSEGERYGETREQFLEVPVGSTLLSRSISLPSNAVSGEWQFKASYETIVQPTIEVYDTLAVGDLTLFEKISRRGLTWMKRNFVWSVMGFLLLIALFILLIALAVNSVGGEKKKKYKKKVHVEAHDRYVYAEQKPRVRG